MRWFDRTLFTLLAATALTAAQASETSSTLVGSNGNCLGASGTLSACSGESDQRFIFGAGGTVFVATSQGNRYLQGDASGKSVSLSSAVSTGNASTYWTRPGGDRLQLTVAGSATALCLSWKGAVQGFDDSGRAIHVPTAELAVCSTTAAANQKWTLASPLAVDWPYTAKTQVKGNAGKCLQQSDFNAPLLASKLSASTCSSVATNEYFQFSNQGAIVLSGFCLTSSGGAGSLVSLGSCSDIGVPPAANQKWKRGSNSTFVSVTTGLCLGVRNRATQDNAGLDLETCDASNPFQQWSTSSAVSGAWPAGLQNKPSTYVPGQTLSSGQVTTLVNWVQGETSISSTPFCYKTQAYDRGAGIAPDCGDGQYKDGLLCYANCRSGFHAVGSMCWSDQSASYTPGSHCTSKDALGNCYAWAIKQDACRSGYTNVLGVCWLDKSSYVNGLGSGPNACKSNREMQDSLCYVKPRSGYQCNATSCNQRCASGIVECGVAACASNANQCVNTVSNMVVSSAMMIGSFATAGAAGEAKSAVMTAKNAYKIARTAYDLEQAMLTLSGDINNFMNLAEKNLASISSNDIEAKIAARYARGTADYRHIAREWAARQMMFYIADLFKDLDTIIITSIDPTGITGVIDAFAKPTCKDHTDMP